MKKLVTAVKVMLMLFGICLMSSMGVSEAQAQAVTWTDLVGVSANGNTITKTAATVWGNAGAASTTVIPGNGGVDFLADDTASHRMAGLSSSNADADYATIGYAIYLAGGDLMVFENGSSMGTFGTYSAGDRVSVKRSGTLVRYKKNGTTFYTSTVPSSGNLVVDAAIYNQGGTIADANLISSANTPPVADAQNTSAIQNTPKAITLTGSDDEGSSLTFSIVGSPAHGSISGTGPTVTYTPANGYVGSDSFTFKANDGSLDSAPATVSISVLSPPVNVVWTNDVGVSVSGNSLTKTAATGWGNAGASSTVSFDGAGGLDFTVTQTNTYVMGGLSNEDADQNYTTVAYGLLANAGSIEIYESGNWQGTFGAYQAGDRFKIERAGSTIYYKQNDVTIYTSMVPSSGTLQADSAIYSNAGVLSDAKMTFIAGPPGVPGNLSGGMGPTSGDVQLNWNASGNNGSVITGYQVQYGTVASGAFASTFNDDAAPGAIITGLTAGTAYQFRVLAINAFGNSATSNVVTVTPGSASAVVWTDALGVNVSGNTITKTAATSWGNGGAVSANVIIGDGGVDFLADEAVSVRMAGLSSESVPFDYATIEYAIYLEAGYIYVNENGAWYGDFGTFTAGDRFSVKRAGSTVRYRKNDVTFYVSTVPSSGILKANGAIYTQDATIADAKIISGGNTAPLAYAQSLTPVQDTPQSVTLTAYDDEGSPLTWTVVSQPAHGALSGTAPNLTYTPAGGYLGSDSFTFKVNDGTTDSNTATVSIAVLPPAVNVVWRDLVGVTANGNSITKTDYAAWGNGGAASDSVIGGNGYIDFRADETNTWRTAGLSGTNADASFESIEYGIYLGGDGTFEVYESGNWVNSFGYYAANDRFIIERIGTTVTYKRNGTTFYTSAVPSTGDLLLDAAVYSEGGTIADARMAGGVLSPIAPEAVDDLSASGGDGEVTLSWSAPYDNGSPITAYDVQYGTVASGAFGSTFNDDATPGAVITGLTNATAYQFRVVARNAIGDSAPSNAATGTPQADAAMAQMITPGVGYILSLPSDRTFRWSAAPGDSSYQVTVGTSVGANDIADSGVTTSNGYNIPNLPLNGASVHVRLSTYIGGTTKFRDYVYQTSAVPVIRITGAGSGSKNFDNGSVAQTVNYTLDLSFDLATSNPVVNGDLTTYSIPYKTGTIHFQGTASDVQGTNTQIFNFDSARTIDIQQIEGTITLSASNPEDVTVQFAIPPTQGSALPDPMYVVYNGLQDRVWVTMEMPFQWNNPVNSPNGVDNVYDVPALDNASGAAGTCSVVLDVENNTLTSGDTVNVSASTILKSGDVLQWALIPGADSTARAKITTDASGKNGVISDVSGNGDLTLRAINPSVPGCLKDFPLVVNECDNCSDGAGSCGDCKVVNHSIKAEVGLGRSERGNSFGSLFLNAKSPSPANATPQKLQISTFGADSSVIYQSTAPRQIVTPENLVDIVVITPYQYEIRYYALSAKGAFVNGVYLINGGATPLKVWTVENPDASASVYHRLRLTETGPSMTPMVYEYVWNSGTSTWTLSKGNGLSMETTTEQTVGNTRTVTSTVRDASNNVASETVTVFETLPSPDGPREEVTSVVEDPNGAALTTTTTYFTNSNDPGFGRIAAQVYPDGSWVRYEYDAQGRISKEITPWLDSPVGTVASSAREVSYSYAPQDASDSQLAEDSRKPRLVIEKILNQTVAKTFYVYQKTAGTRTDIVDRAAGVNAVYGGAGNLRTTTVYLANSAWRVSSVTHPDGTRDTYTYEKGTYTPNGNPAIPGTFAVSASGKHERETVVHGNTSAPAGVPFKTGSERVVRNELGEVLLEERFVYNGSAQVAIGWTVNRYDAYGHLTIVNKSEGTQTDSTWGAAQRLTDTDAAGTLVSYTYDAAGRLATRVKEAGTNDVTTTYTYDGANRRLSETTTSAGLSTATSSTYNVAGQMLTSTDAAGLVTNYSTDTPNRTSTVTRPGGAYETTEQYIDGQIKNVTGSGTVEQFFTAGVNADGSRWTQVNVSASGSPNYEKTTVDMLGRTIRVDRPGASGEESVFHFYNNQGYLVRTTTTGQSQTLYEYDSLGNQTRSGLDVDNSGALVLNSTDRISESDTVFALISTNWWQQTTQKVYAQFSATPTTTGVSRSRLSGFAGGVVEETVSIDINNNTTTATTSINRAAKTQTRTVDVPDSDTNAVSVTVNGLMTSNTSQSNVTTTFGYDAIERPATVTDPRAGTTTTAYSATTGQVTSVTDPGSRVTSFTYDSAGRKATETNALSQVTRFAYNDLNQVTHTWGDVPYPVRYVYDEYGRMTEMHTWRSGAGFNGATFPAGVEGLQDVTTWGYDAATGLLLSKTDANSQSVNYTYTTGGKLLTRTWARLSGGSPVVTTYGYDPNTAELLTVNYSDATPDVTFTYDRLGRPSTVVDGLGTRTFAYNAALAPLTETITGLYSKVITRTYATTGVIGRPTGFNTGASVYSNTWGYDTKGRLNSVAWTITGATAGSATYAYTANSDLLATLTRGTRVTTYTYEATRDLKTQVRNQVGATIVSQYDYINDNIGRRTSVVNTGTGFTASAFSLWGYNDRSELTGSNRYLGTNITVLTSPVTAENRAFVYDPIGNRTNMTVGATAGTYVANNLNQYTTQTGPANTFTHDLDGNLAQITGTRNVVFTYDGENRLLSVQPVTPVNNNKRLEFVYDYQGRRVQKLIYNRSAGAWVLQTTKRFVYDGWNMIEEQTVSAATKYYVYGLDLSQSLQGAGGVGGLLAKAEGSATHNYFYDANGNVAQMVNASGGAITARYEYDAYGNSILATGAQATANPFRFSSKYFDTEFSLYYYGYRYYDPSTGRWVNRDPQEELGGMNLYGFVHNNPIGMFDILGLGYWDDVGQVYVGYWNGAKGLAEGTAYMTRHPLETLKGLYFAAANPKETYAAIVEHYSEKSQTYAGRGEIVFDILTVVVPISKAKEIATIAKAVQLKKAEKICKIQKVLNKTAFKPLVVISEEGFRTFREFKRVYGIAGEGSAWHHIVEQSQIRYNIPPGLIHHPGNLIKLPDGKGTIHAKISGYYSSIQQFSKPLTVRQWLRGQSFQKQYEFGIKIIKDFGGDQYLK